VPVAVVELRRGVAPLTSAELLAYATTVLARYELPAALHVVADIPRTESGKIDQLALAALLEAQPTPD
jgi:acyl-coenzyme A synthetase/AMP-(fatty) acid ligase